MINGTIAYNALSAKDSRFDGVFFVGVTTTGIYCRPICPARTPKSENCRYFGSPEEAEKAHFRPCLRCRPELAPGLAPIDDAGRIARMIISYQHENPSGNPLSVEALAHRFDISSRQLRRIVQKELGVSPIELLQTRRLLLAKQLLTETRLPITEVAFASGFSSLRRFNAAFRKHYHMPPNKIRKVSLAHTQGFEDLKDEITLQLKYRPPFDWGHLLQFLKMRMIKEVELITDEYYARTVALHECQGWIKVVNDQDSNALRVTFSRSLVPVLSTMLNRLRNLFDLSARPDLINAHLGLDKRLAGAVAAHPGMRVPGAFDGFEMAFRAILGQQISVKAATTIATRLATRFGKPIRTPYEGLSRLTPLADCLANAQMDDVASLGIVNTRAHSIISMAQSLVRGDLWLDGRMDLKRTVSKLKELPGVGPWTANYIAMRALGWPDAFLASDIVLLKNLGGFGAKEAEEISQNWRPWRSYAVMHIWNSPAAGLATDTVAT